MKKQFKFLLYFGLILIIGGIVCKFFHILVLISNSMLISGGILKLIYLTLRIRNTSYKPGNEILFLLAGLLIFLSGKYLVKVQPYSIILISTGIISKVIFIYLILKKLGAN